MTHLDWELSAFLDGELEPSDRSRVAKHLLGCEVCRAELDEISSVRGTLRGLPMLEAPIGLLPEVSQAPMHRRRSVWIGAAAAVVAAVIGVATLTAPATDLGSIDDLANRFGARQSLDPTFSPAKALPNLESDE